ncbi:hypothetical protein Tco_0912855 [Tanacetum coccineum]
MSFINTSSRGKLQQLKMRQLVHDTLSPADAETGANLEQPMSEADTEILSVGVEQGEDVSNTVALKDRTIKLDAG